MAILLLAFIYISFISLGLPDSMLGAAWPVIRSDLNLPVYTAGIISLTITCSTVVSSMLNPFIVKKIGTGKIVVISTLFSSIGLFTFSHAPSFVFLGLSAVLIGLGGGSIDAALNNFVALHYQAKHMNWLHSLWGVGTTLGSYIISIFIVYPEGWRKGYLVVSAFQLLLATLFFILLPVWNIYEKDNNNKSSNIRKNERKKSLLFASAAISIITFFFYCAIETTTGLWASSFLVNYKHISPSIAAKGTSSFFFGITIGRILSGFVSMKLSGKKIIRLSLALLFTGIFVLLTDVPQMIYLFGFALIGFGCAPIFPTMMHETPKRFGEDISHIVISMQMAAGYLGSALAPLLFGIVISMIGVYVLPLYLLILLFILTLFTELLNYQLNKKAEGL
ncbi:MFS transporter [Caldicellulosiruptor sp. F32]|uniref:MFS transporter n=1 Tax=Caldicellulosiruptor sp. F32 TaxID=1214564 RepID=UPI00058468C8|nr:MFS transporter [Caldicellulosiruptor sp. F32]